VIELYCKFLLVHPAILQKLRFPQAMFMLLVFAMAQLPNMAIGKTQYSMKSIFPGIIPALASACVFESPPPDFN